MDPAHSLQAPKKHDAKAKPYSVDKEIRFAKTAVDLQRLKLEKLMQNPVSFQIINYL